MSSLDNVRKVDVMGLVGLSDFWLVLATSDKRDPFIVKGPTQYEAQKKIGKIKYWKMINLGAIMNALDSVEKWRAFVESLE